MKLKEPSEYYLLKTEKKLKFFNIIKKRNGILPAIITTDGFLNQDNDDVKQWEIAIKKKYTNNAWYHLNWESENAKRLLIRTTSKLHIPFFISALTLHSINLKLPKAYYGLRGGVMETWNNALRNSEKTGEFLSDVLFSCEIDEYILIGHSLGGRVIFNCLNNLKLHNKKIIKDVHLLGGAVSNNITNWNLAEKSIKNKIYNYYSKKDNVLKIAYRLATSDNSPIGITNIDSRKSENVNVTNFVNSHTAFKETFEQYIK